MPGQWRRNGLGLLALVGPAVAIDNGLGLTPPLGWRSWNLFGPNVNQALLERIMDGIVSRKRMVDGKPTSLCDLGYCDVGLDDAWQACGEGTNGYHYHTGGSGNSYHSVINTTRFPDMKAMTDKAHSLGLTAGWYHNNCICGESKDSPQEVYEGDVAALANFGFDAVKLDGCGTQRDLDLWAKLINATGRRVMIENCHWGQTVPKGDWCPWNFFRTSGDVSASYGSVMSNLQTTIQWAQTGLSRPGCWAYPDMLEVGCGGGLNAVETRAHFGAWCIVSSPLTLSMDVTDDKIMDEVWPLITNMEAVAVNQAWAGHSGSPFKQAVEMVQLAHQQVKGREVLGEVHTDLPKWQYFQKPLGNGRVAVLMLNHADSTQNLTLSFADVPGLGCSRCLVRDIWQRKDLGVLQGSLTQTLVSHDSAFLVLSSAAGPHEEEIDIVV